MAASSNAAHADGVENTVMLNRRPEFSPIWIRNIRGPRRNESEF
jgi:hypothetical protein